MSYSDPTHWRDRARDMRAAAEALQDCVSKQMMRRMAEDYERLAQAAEQRAKDCPPPPAVRILAVPAAARHFARRRIRFAAAPPGTPDPAIPRFLKVGPATAEEVGAPVGTGPEILMRIAREPATAPAVDGEIAMLEPWVPARPKPKGD